MDALETILLSSFVAVEGAHAFSAFNPSIFTIRKFKEKITQKSIREGYILGSIFALVLGVLVALIAKSCLPIVFAIFTIVFMVSVYEYALHS